MKIITTYHHGFAGGSKNTSRLLHLLAQRKNCVDAFFFETPQYFSYTSSAVRSHILGEIPIHSDVIPSHALAEYGMVEHIVDHAIKAEEESILFGANMFPYCNILHEAKSQLQQLYGYSPQLILHPVGSDMWQIGPQIRSRVRWLLESPLVDAVVTYSEEFIAEIQKYYGITRDIQVIQPVLETDRFYPLNEMQRAARRQELGFCEEHFIMHHHSSMRPIKCTNVVLSLALEVSKQVREKCVLILCGPVPSGFFSNHVLFLGMANTSMNWKIARINNLTVICTDIVVDPQYTLQVSDVEINASLHDSFNLSLMEAMACGIPVVSSDTAGISAHITAAQAGYCFRAKRLGFDEIAAVIGNEEKMTRFFDMRIATDALVELARNRPKAAALGAAGARYAANVFSSETAINQFYNITAHASRHL